MQKYKSSGLCKKLVKKKQGAINVTVTLNSFFFFLGSVTPFLLLKVRKVHSMPGCDKLIQNDEPLPVSVTA